MPEQLYQITSDMLPSPEQVDALLGYCQAMAEEDRINGRKIWITRHLVVHLACGAGLKAGEIALLRVGDLHRRGGENFLRARRAGGEKHHRVHLGPGLAAHIAQYLHTRWSAWGEEPEQGELLLPGRGGQPYSTAALCFSFRRAVEEAGLPGQFSLGNARHFYAAFLLAKTQDLRYVQRQLGHANQSMTVLYLDVIPRLDHRQAQAAIW